MLGSNKGVAVAVASLVVAGLVPAVYASHTGTETGECVDNPLTGLPDDVQVAQICLVGVIDQVQVVESLDYLNTNSMDLITAGLVLADLPGTNGATVPGAGTNDPCQPYWAQGWDCEDNDPFRFDDERTVHVVTGVDPDPDRDVLCLWESSYEIHLNGDDQPEYSVPGYWLSTPFTHNLDFSQPCGGWV